MECEPMWLQIGKQLYFQLRLVGICKNPFSNSSKRWIICLTSALEWLSIHLSTCLLRYLGFQASVLKDWRHKIVLVCWWR